MCVIMPERATTDTFPPPSWGTSHRWFGEVIAWSHKVELPAAEVDGEEEGLTIEAHVYDSIQADQSGVTVHRGPVEVQITRCDMNGKEDPDEVPLRFEIADARKVIAAIQKCIDAVEANTSAPA